VLALQVESTGNSLRESFDSVTGGVIEGGPVDMTRLTGGPGWTSMKEAVNENRVWTPLPDSSTFTKRSFVSEGVTEGAAEDVKGSKGHIDGNVFQHTGAVKGVLVPVKQFVDIILLGSGVRKWSAQPSD